MNSAFLQGFFYAPVGWLELWFGSRIEHPNRKALFRSISE